jgi:hypothetical protein
MDAEGTRYGKTLARTNNGVVNAPGEIAGVI